MHKQIFNRVSRINFALCLGAGALFLSFGLAWAGSPDPGFHIFPRAVAASNALNSPCPAWATVQSPNDGPYDNVLYGISAASPNEVWAVGYTASGDAQKTLAMRWDGQTWTIVPSPNPGQGTNYFNSVAALSTDDVWILGSSGSGQHPVPFIEHWDGHAWTQSRLPELDPSGNELYAISASASNDIWAVGSVGCQNCKTEHSLVMHYNGVDWSVTPQSAGGYADALFGIYALSANDVWAAGYFFGNSGAQPLVEHWNGQAWDVVNPQRLGGSNNFLNAVWGVAPTDVWAVGSQQNYQHNALLIEHWDGQHWISIDTPNPSEEGTVLFGVAASSSSNVWAVGYFIASGVRHALLMQYDGHNWAQSTITDAGPGATLYAASAAQGGNPMAAGYIGSAGSRRTLIEQYADTCAPPPPPATPTNAPLPPTTIPAPVATLPIPGDNSRTFAETGKTVSGLFLDYWDHNGGLAQQGYPISPVVGELSDLDHKPYTVQYFERAVFEYHPENQAPYNVLLSQLGTFQYKKKYATGAPGQQANNTDGSVLFPETGKRVGGKFLQYWRANGGLAQQGYPISEEFTEVSDLDHKPYLVQYFERAVFELHPENQAPYDVLLSQLGTFQYKQKFQSK